MNLNFKDIEFDSFGIPDVPELQIRTMGGEILGMISNFYDLKLTIKFAEPSEISFSVPHYCDGKETPFYDILTSYKILYTKHYGIYIIYGSESKSDGVEDVLEVSGYSLEKALENRKFFIEEGTFNFWNPASPSNTILGRLLEVATGWHVGHVDPALIGKYRTFEEFDDYLLSFCYETCPKKYRCVFSFDTYEKSINVYDADATRSTTPIYLDFDNLVEELTISEDNSEMVTALRPYGADSVDIRDVNPLGTNWMYNLSYFIENGDLNGALAEKYLRWQREILSKQNLYRGLVSMKAAATAEEMLEKAKLTDLEGEVTDLTNQQSVAVQALAMEVTEVGKEYSQTTLDEINKRLTTKKAEVETQKKKVEALDARIKDYTKQIQSVVDTLAIDKYFSKKEYETLSYYFIEQDMTEDTFVATDLDVGISGDNYSFTTGSIKVTGAKIVRTRLTDINATINLKKTIYAISGGTFTITGDSKTVKGNIIRGTLDYGDDKSFSCSFYAESITVGEATASTGVVTMTGTGTSYSDDVKTVTDNDLNPGIDTAYPGDIEQEAGEALKSDIGSTLTLGAKAVTMFVTAEIADFQRYSVEMDLYDYAKKKLSEWCFPTYEFDVDAANFIFARDFKPFRDKLSLGNGIYVRMNEKSVRTPILIEIELDFEDISSLTLTFSNRFKRHDPVNTLKDMLDTSYSSSRNFDASKYIYNQTVGQQSAISDFMNNSLDAAKNTILSSKNQSVSISGAGIRVSSDSQYEIRIVDSMIAMTDDGWQHAKLAIGRFASPEVGEYWGVNADVIGGKLIIGNNLIIENTNDTGVLQFRVDATGAWLYNATFILCSDQPSPVSLEDEPMPMAIDSAVPNGAAQGGKIILDPKYGIVGGNKDLFTTKGTTVYPSFIKADGTIELDKDKFPKNANFFLDIRDGSAYFRGRIQSGSGQIGGWTIDQYRLSSGTGITQVTLVGDYDGPKNEIYDSYAFWAGGTTPDSAKFWIKKNGDMKATNGQFSGRIDANSVVFGIDTGNGPTDKSINAIVGDMEASITVNADAIKSEVKNREKAIESVMTQTADAIKTEVKNREKAIESVMTQTADSIKTEVKNREQAIQSVITQTSEAITAEVTARTTAIDGVTKLVNQSITLDADGFAVRTGGGGKVTINGGSINLNGHISFSDFNPDLTTKINNKLESSALSGYAKESWVSGQNYATQKWVNDKGFVNASEVTTTISKYLVASPNIQGAKYWNFDTTGHMEMQTFAAGGKTVPSFALYSDYYNSSRSPYFYLTYADAVSGSGASLTGPFTVFLGPKLFLTCGESGGSAYVRPVGTWDFSKATVSGIGGDMKAKWS